MRSLRFLVLAFCLVAVLLAGSSPPASAFLPNVCIWPDDELDAGPGSAVDTADQSSAGHVEDAAASKATSETPRRGFDVNASETRSTTVSILLQLYKLLVLTP